MRTFYIINKIIKWNKFEFPRVTKYLLPIMKIKMFTLLLILRIILYLIVTMTSKCKGKEARTPQHFQLPTDHCFFLPFITYLSLLQQTRIIYISLFNGKLVSVIRSVLYFNLSTSIRSVRLTCIFKRDILLSSEMVFTFFI
jgi:hypothetical protein